MQALLEPLSVRYAADHLTREPLDYLATAGFEIDFVERSKWGILERVIARKPIAARGEAPELKRALTGPIG